MLAQQIVDLVDTACLRIFNGYQPIVGLACGNCMEDISKTAVGNRLCFDLVIPSIIYAAKIDPRRLIAKGPPFALKCNPDPGMEILRRYIFRFLIYRHTTTSPSISDCADCAS